MRLEHVDRRVERQRTTIDMIGGGGDACGRSWLSSMTTAPSCGSATAIGGCCRAPNFNGGWSSIGIPGDLSARPGELRAPPGARREPRQVRVARSAVRGARSARCASTCTFQYTFFDNLIEKTTRTRRYAEVNYDFSDSDDSCISRRCTRIGHAAVELVAVVSAAVAVRTGPDLRRRTPACISTRPTTRTCFAAHAPACPTSIPCRFISGRGLGSNGRDGNRWMRIDASKPIALGTSSDRQLRRMTASATTSRSRYSNREPQSATARHGAWSRWRSRWTASADRAARRGRPRRRRQPAWRLPVLQPVLERDPVFGANGASEPAVVRFANRRLPNSQHRRDVRLARTRAVANETNNCSCGTASSTATRGFSLPGGTIGWAVGVQARNEKYDSGCATSRTAPGIRARRRIRSRSRWASSRPTSSVRTATVQTGLIAFGVPGDDDDTTRNVYAVFSEFALPITDTFDAQFALRFEDYGRKAARRSIRSWPSSGRRSTGWRCAARSRRRSAVRRCRI